MKTTCKTKWNCLQEWMKENKIPQPKKVKKQEEE